MSGFFLGFCARVDYGRFLLGQGCSDCPRWKRAVEDSRKSGNFECKQRVFALPGLVAHIPGDRNSFSESGRPLGVGGGGTGKRDRIS